MAPNNTDNVTKEVLPPGTVSVSPPVKTTGQTPEGTAFDEGHAGSFELGT